MALARTLSVALVGMQAHLVEVEADVANGVPGFTLTALADRVLRQAESRVKAAVRNSGEQWPNRRVTVGMLPAAVPKVGSRFDAALAVAVLAANEAVPAEGLRDLAILGELGLDGRLHSVSGVLPALVGALREGCRRFVVPRANAREARLVGPADVMVVGSLAELCARLRGEPWEVDDTGTDAAGGVTRDVTDSPAVPDLLDVVGQDDARHALEVAAAGGHHLLLQGPPGVGKTMLAERLPGLLPPLSDDDALDVTALHSIAGRLPSGEPLITQPPFCAPHHSATLAAVVGGGSGVAAPGAVSLAHCGVLFLDEAPEFRPTVLDALRQPLESGTVTLARAGGVATYPSRFQLVLAANPCGCTGGSEGSRASACTCSANELRRYASRLSGPVRDRVDLTVVLAPLSRAVLDDGACGESTAVVRERVADARARAAARMRGTPWQTNAAVPGPVLRRHWPIPADALRPLHRVVDRGLLSTRGIDRVVKVAWTLADLAGHDRPGRDEVARAFALRAGQQALAYAVPA